MPVGDEAEARAGPFTDDDLERMRYDLEEEPFAEESHRAHGLALLKEVRRLTHCDACGKPLPTSDTEPKGRYRILCENDRFWRNMGHDV